MPGRIIPFSPPDITRREIRAVVKTLKSGWITTGPRVDEFESRLAAYCGVEGAVCVSSATAGLELCLRLFGIGPGDEVITTPYTYAATANVILHVGARPVFADVKKGSFCIDPEGVARAVTGRTKAVIPVDFGGMPADYEGIHGALASKKRKYRPNRGSSPQRSLDRPLVLADAAHSFGATCRGRKTGGCADLTVFSFHAVKNLTTAEGGAVTYNSFGGIRAPGIHESLRLLALHGQSKDARAKAMAGGWRYEILLPGYKYNMTDIAAALGIAQLERYDGEILPARKRIAGAYARELSGDERFMMPEFKSGNTESSYHLFPLRVRGYGEEERDRLIGRMAEKGISLNVHFIPVVMHPYYRRLGFRMKDFPNALEMYRNEVSLPLYPRLSLRDVRYICRVLKRLV